MAHSSDAKSTMMSKEYPDAGHPFLDDYKGLIGVLGVVIGARYKDEDAADARGRILAVFARHLA